MAPIRHRTTPFVSPKRPSKPPPPISTREVTEGENSTGTLTGGVEGSSAGGESPSMPLAGLATSYAANDGRLSGIEEEVGEGDEASSLLGRGRRRASKVDYFALDAGDGYLPVEGDVELPPRRSAHPSADVSFSPAPTFRRWDTAHDTSLRQLWSADVSVVDITKKLDRAKEDVEERLRAFRLLEAAEGDEENDGGFDDGQEDEESVALLDEVGEGLDEDEDRMNTEAGGGIAQDDSSRTSSAEEANGTPRLKDLEESLPARSAHVLPRTSASPTLESIDEEMLETPESEAPAVSSTTAAVAPSTLPAGWNKRTYRPWWTPADNALLHQLADQGVSSAKIAEQLGRSAIAVDAKLNRAKKKEVQVREDSANKPLPPRRATLGVTYVAGLNEETKQRRRKDGWTAGEDAELRRGRAAGETANAISERIGRSATAVQQRWGKKSKAWEAAGLIPAPNIVNPTHLLADLAAPRQPHPPSSPQPATSSFSPSTTPQRTLEPAFTASAAPAHFPPPPKKQRLSLSSAAQSSSSPSASPNFSPYAYASALVPAAAPVPGASVVSSAAASHASSASTATSSQSGAAIYARIAASVDTSPAGIKAMFSRLRSALAGEEDEEW